MISLYCKRKKKQRDEVSLFLLSSRVLITLQLQEQLEQLEVTHQQLDLEGSCERYARA